MAMVGKIGKRKRQIYTWTTNNVCTTITSKFVTKRYDGEHRSSHNFACASEIGRGPSWATRKPPENTRANISGGGCGGRIQHVAVLCPMFPYFKQWVPPVKDNQQMR